MIEFNCPSCGTAMTARASMIGYMKTCPKCGTSASVSNPDGESVERITPSIAWRLCASGLVVAGGLAVAMGLVLFFDRPDMGIYNLTTEQIPACGDKQAYTHIVGEVYNRAARTWGALITIAGMLPFVVGLSILHRESLQRRQR